MNNKQFEKYSSIPADKFAFAQSGDRLHDQKFDTKPVGYLRDAFGRFKRNKASLVAAIIIIILALFAIVGPWCMDSGYQDSYVSEKNICQYKELLPRLEIFNGTGFWDGTKVIEVNENRLMRYQGMAIETGHNPVEKIIAENITYDETGAEHTMYKIRLNTYYACSAFKITIPQDEYEALMAWQDEHGIQVILPRVQNTANNTMLDIWYKSDKKGNAILDKDGNLQPDYYTTERDGYTSTMRLAGDPGLLALERVAGITNEEERQATLDNDPDWQARWRYAQRTGKQSTGYNYVLRVSAYNFFQYRYGFKPSFAFGTDSQGYDIFSRLAKGARFSFLLAICVSAINLTIGAIYGAIEGYFGGTIDLVMERISDILGGVPFMVVTVLFQLHLAAKVGVVGALIYAFVLTGWIGMASRVRMQFYRFKNQEYVLAARTLGAKDWRIIWKHIFPNTLGTLITGCVLVIPGVIFSETSLSYLGIINLDSPTLSSVGAMLSAGQGVMTNSPHVVFFPALFIALLEICFNLFGNGLRDAFNPSLRGVEE